MEEDLLWKSQEGFPKEVVLVLQKLLLVNQPATIRQVYSLPQQDCLEIHRAICALGEKTFLSLAL